jgi:hypothetical protein
VAKPAWHGHYLRHNCANQRPQHFVFVDVETEQELVKTTHKYTKHTLKLGVACYVNWRKGREPQETWFDFDHATHFWEWLRLRQRKKAVLWCVAHNAQFDFTILGLWQLIDEGAYATRTAGKAYVDSRTGDQRVSADWYGTVAIEGTPFHVETSGPRGRVNFTDLQNYYQCSLARIGETVGVAKGEWDEVRQNEDNLRAYCHNDVEILKRGYLGLVRQWEEDGNGNWQFSAAGLAQSNYRHKYLDTPIAIHNHALASGLEWAALYGGECRCWFRGLVDNPLVQYDANSLYPSVMVDGVFPTALVDVVMRPTRQLFRSLIDRYATVASVTLKTPTDRYPVRYKGKLVYPVGQFETTLAGPELQDALDNGHIIHCDMLALYTYGQIFKRYVLEWWSRKKLAKQKGDLATEKFCKLMLNSLPAKFAQRTPSWEVEPKVDVCAPWKRFPWKDPATGVIYPARSFGWIGQVCRHRVATEHSFPAIYAYVTSYARLKMREFRKHVPPSILYYQDTDSLIVGRECVDAGSLADWPIGDELGAMRLVGEYHSAEFRGPKNYTLDARHVIAGIRQRDTEVAPMQWTGERFERSNHLFTRGPDGTLRAKQVDIDTPGSDTEGGRRDDGFAKPLRLPEDMPDDVFARIVSDSHRQELFR